MLKNYLLVAARNLLKRKGQAAINIVGLGVGLACCLLIFQYVAFERSYDRFHEHADDIYRLIRTGGRIGEAMDAGATFTPQAMGPELERSVPEIVRFARVHMNDAVVSRPDRADRVFEEDDILYVDSSFVGMFTFPLIEGDPREALHPGNLLMSATAARRYFGDDDAIGQTLRVAGQIDRVYRVSGVMADVPDNSHLQFDFLLPMADLLRDGQYAEEPDDGWSWNNFTTYIQLHADIDPTVAQRKIEAVYEARRGEIMRERGWESEARLQPLSQVYLNDDIHSFIGRAGSERTVDFFTVIGLVTLLIALVNYVNLATARALDRAREVGVRKAVGAARRQLVGQFLAESAVTIGAATMLGGILATLALPLVNQLADTHLSWVLWREPVVLTSALATLLVAVLLGGLYPSLVMSAFRPASALRGGVNLTGRGLTVRRALVIVQFTSAVALIGGTGIVYSQLRFMQNMDLGLELDQVITVPGPRVFPEGMTPLDARRTFVEELRRQPEVRQIATSWSLPGEGFNWSGASTWRAEKDETSSISARVTYVDTSFIDLYGLELVAGELFRPSTEMTEPYPYLATETTIRALGFATPEEALRHPLRLGTGDPYEIELVGVLRDFNWSSAHDERDLVLFGSTVVGPHVSIRPAAADVSATIAAAERVFQRLFPGNVFRYSFADEAFARQYREDQRFATLFSIFAALAIAIACLGLFGLATFTAQQRTKEIGVRKVLGAAVPALVALLARDFLKLVVIAVLLGSPVAYLIMQKWLDDFAYRVDVGPGLFLVVGALSLTIALLTVSYQSIRAALADPVRSLRTD